MKDAIILTDRRTQTHEHTGYNYPVILHTILYWKIIHSERKLFWVLSVVVVQ